MAWLSGKRRERCIFLFWGQRPLVRLTVEEAAELLRLSGSAIYRRVELGELRAVRLGSGPRAPIRIPSEELERYVERGRGPLVVAGAGER